MVAFVLQFFWVVAASSPPRFSVTLLVSFLIRRVRDGFGPQGVLFPRGERLSVSIGLQTEEIWIFWQRLKVKVPPTGDANSCTGINIGKEAWEFAYQPHQARA